MKPKVSITTQNYFGDQFYYVGWVLLIACIPLGIALWYVGVIALLLGIMVITTTYKLVIDQNSGQIEDFMSILGMKNGCIIKKFNRLDYVSIKSGRYSQQIQLRAASTVIEGTMYSAYLITDIENFYLGESKNKKRILKKATQVAAKLNIEFKDLSVR